MIHNAYCSVKLSSRQRFRRLVHAVAGRFHVGSVPSSLVLAVLQTFEASISILFFFSLTFKLVKLVNISISYIVNIFNLPLGFLIPSI